MTQVKADGIGFKILTSADFPKIITEEGADEVSEESLPSAVVPLTSATPNDSTFTEEDDVEDPLYEYLLARKELRLKFEQRYSQKAVAISSYQRHSFHGDIAEKSKHFLLRRYG